MTTYKVAKTLSTAEAAYIAGLIDGEGTITLIRKHRNENRQLAVSISSTEPQLLEFVRRVAGVGKITNKTRSKSHHLDSYTYAVYNRQALHILGQIQPYLRSYKAARSALALSRYISVTPRNGKYNRCRTDARKQFEECFLSIKPRVSDKQPS